MSILHSFFHQRILSLILKNREFFGYSPALIFGNLENLGPFAKLPISCSGANQCLVYLGGPVNVLIIREPAIIISSLRQRFSHTKALSFVYSQKSLANFKSNQVCDMGNVYIGSICFITNNSPKEFFANNVCIQSYFLKDKNSFNFFPFLSKNL